MRPDFLSQQDTHMPLKQYNPRSKMTVYQEPKYLIDQNTARVRNRQSGAAIPEDEPIFIFRASDRKAAEVLWHYSAHCKDKIHRKAVETRALQFENWAQEHPSRMKEPDTSVNEGWTDRGSP